MCPSLCSQRPHTGASICILMSQVRNRPAGEKWLAMAVRTTPSCLTPQPALLTSKLKDRALVCGDSRVSGHWLGHPVHWKRDIPWNRTDSTLAAFLDKPVPLWSLDSHICKMRQYFSFRAVLKTRNLKCREPISSPSTEAPSKK